ncbi:MAG TPA: PIN domain-containing protein [Thermoanaerobaculia bacterium]
MTGPVLVDTSVWINTLRRKGDPELRAELHAAIAAGRAVLCDPVLIELWNGARGAPEQRHLRELQGSLRKVAISPPVWEAAHELARICRRAGVSAPAIDILIAACAEHYRLTVLHRDAHFDDIERARHSGT